MNDLPQVSGSVDRFHPNQINLRALFSVELILKSRGYEIKKKGQLYELLIPTIKFGDNEYNMLLQCFNNKTFRKEIHDFIVNDKAPSSREAQLVISHKDFVKSQQVFTKTFEWYIGEAMAGFF